MINIKNLKILFLAIASFYLFFHFIGPAIFYLAFGYTGLYRSEIVDFDSMKLGFLLNILSIALAGILVWITPVKFKSEPNWKEVNSTLF
jgi:hypothetical protein